MGTVFPDDLFLIFFLFEFRQIQLRHALAPLGEEIVEHPYWKEDITPWSQKVKRALSGLP